MSQPSYLKGGKLSKILGSLSLQRERLYFSKAIIGRGTSMGNFRNAFSRGVGDPFADRPTLVHSRNDGRRPTDSAKTWAHPDTQCEGERVSAASLWFFRCRFKRDELMQMANLEGDKSWPGRRRGTFQLFLSAAFVLAVRTRRPSDGCPWRCRQPTSLSFCLSHSFSH